MTESEAIEICANKYALEPSSEKRAKIREAVRFSAGLEKAGVQHPNAWQRRFDLQLAKRLEQVEQSLAPASQTARPQVEPIEWREVAVVAANAAKIIAIPVVVIGGGIWAVAFIVGAAQGAMVWAAANAGWIGGVIGGLIFFVVLPTALPKWNSGGEESGASGSTVQRQNITVNVNVNAANGGNAEQK